MVSRNIKLVLEYDGARFSGWQVQPELRTVQGAVEEAVAKLTGEACRVTGASRTDAGVHALGQVANFHASREYPPEVFKRALNALLPRDVAVKDAGDADEDFDARHRARRKLYRYIIHNRRERSVFDQDYSWYHPVNLDMEAMREAALFFTGEHDFSSFRSSTCSAKSPVRNLYGIDISQNDSRIRIEMSASGFLKQMARTIVGTLVSVGEGRLLPGRIPGIIEARDRSAAGPTAPARGLFLVSVDYDIKEDK